MEREELANLLNELENREVKRKIVDPAINLELTDLIINKGIDPCLLSKNFLDFGVLVEQFPDHPGSALIHYDAQNRQRTISFLDPEVDEDFDRFAIYLPDQEEYISDIDLIINSQLDGMLMDVANRYYNPAKKRHYVVPEVIDWIYKLGINVAKAQIYNHATYRIKQYDSNPERFDIFDIKQSFS